MNFLKNFPQCSDNISTLRVVLGRACLPGTDLLVRICWCGFDGASLTGIG